MEEVITIAQIVHRGTDILSLNNEEIEALVDEIYSTLKGSNDIKNIRLIDFLFTLKDFVNHVRAEQSKLPDLSMPMGAYIRQLLVDPDVVPIVSEKKKELRVRPSTRKEIFLINGTHLAVPAEAPIEIYGLKLRLKSFSPQCFMRMAEIGSFSPETLGYVASGANLTNFIRVFMKCVDQETWKKNGEGVVVTTKENIIQFTHQYIELYKFLRSGGHSWLINRLAEEMVHRKLDREDQGSHISNIVETEEIEPEENIKRVIFFLKELSTMYSVSPVFTSGYMPLLYDLYRAGYLEVLWNPVEQKFLQHAEQREKEQMILQQVDMKLTEVITQARQYFKIMEKKIGRVQSDAIREILTMEGKVDDPNSILQEVIKACGKQEAELITTEYLNIKKQWELQEKNACAHLKLVKQLRSGLQYAELLKVLESIRVLYKEKNNTTNWNLCKACGFKLLCPHVDMLIQLQAAEASYDTMRTKLMKFSGINKEKENNQGLIYSYFCKICGEELAHFIQEDRTADVGVIGDLNSKLRIFIWQETMKACTFIHFGKLVDVKQFANIAVNVCLPLVYSIENIKKEEDYDPLTQLYAVIYIYAYILNLIYSSQKNKEFLTITIHGMKADSSLNAYVTFLLEKMMQQYSGIINQLSEITDQWIANNFREAFKKIIHQNGLQGLSVQDDTKVLLTEILLDPMYDYAATVARIDGSIPMHKPRTPKEAEYEFKTVIGRTPAELLSQKEFYDKIYTSKYRPDFTQLARLNDIYFQEESLRVWWGGRDEEKTSTLIYLRAYELFLKYLQNAPNFNSELAEFKTYENAYGEQKALLAQQGFYNIFDPNTGRADQRTRLFEYKRLPISTLYDERGLPHKWTIYVYKAVDSSQKPAEIEVTRKDVIKKIDNHYALADLRCSVCHVLQHEVGQLNIKKVQTALKASLEFNTFYAFYESRCPKGGLHDFQDKKCVKCGLFTYIIYDHLSQPELVHDYYNNYKDQYDKEKMSIRSIQIKKDMTTPSSETQPKPPQEPWTFDYGKIIKTAKILDISPAVIEAIGAMEGRSYADIREGQGAPPPPTSMDDPRLMAVDSAVRIFLYNYNCLRHVSTFNKPPMHVERLVKHLSYEEKEDLEKVLPNVVNEYHTTFKHLRVTDPASALLYSIEFLCVSFLTLYEIKEPSWVVNIVREFALTELNTIIQSEKLLSKPGAFNFMIFGEDFVCSGEDSSMDDISAYSSPGLFGEDIIDRLDDPFSIEDVDISLDVLDNLAPQ